MNFIGLGDVLGKFVQGFIQFFLKLFEYFFTTVYKGYSKILLTVLKYMQNLIRYSARIVTR